MPKPYHIITFDGGGILGLYSITLFARLASVYPELVPSTDLLAGTSTGGLIALSLAAGNAPEKIMDLYLLRANEIFSRRLSYSLTTLWGLCGTKYHNTGLINVCRSTFGNQLLGQLPRKVVIPAFNLMSDGTPENPSWRTRFFHNLNDDDGRELVSDIAIRTSSAPAYFPTYQGYCDGGVFANSPATVAIAQAIEKGEADLKDIRLLSVGTGGQIRYIDGQQLQWGALKWARPVIDIFMDGQSLVTEATSRKLLADRYFRLDPICPNIAMDDTSKMAQLMRLANEIDLKPAIRWLRDIYFK